MGGVSDGAVDRSPDCLGGKNGVALVDRCAPCSLYCMRNLLADSTVRRVESSIRGGIGFTLRVCRSGDLVLGRTSHYDSLLPMRTLVVVATPLLLRRAASPFHIFNAILELRSPRLRVGIVSTRDPSVSSL